MPADNFRSAVLILPDITPAGAIALAVEDEDNASNAILRVAGEFAAVAKKLQRVGELLRKTEARIRVSGGEAVVSNSDLTITKLVTERLAAEVKE